MQVLMPVNHVNMATISLHIFSQTEIRLCLFYASLALPTKNTLNASPILLKIVQNASPQANHACLPACLPAFLTGLNLLSS